MVCKGFFQGSIHEQLNDNAPYEAFEEFRGYQSQNRIIQLKFDSKKDAREILGGLMQRFPEPTLLFLGNITEYSIPLQEGLLKILEEPPRNLQIIMFAHSAQEILPTIASRSSLIHLPGELVLKILDTDKAQKISKKLPNPTEFTKALLTSQVTQETISGLDIVKLERDEIDFWLWQVGMNLDHVYSKTPKKGIAVVMKKVLQAKHSNQANVQKKFVFYQLLS